MWLDDIFNFRNPSLLKILCIFIFRITRRWRNENITRDKSAYFRLISWDSSARYFKTQHSNLCYICIHGVQWKKQLWKTTNIIWKWTVHAQVNRSTMRNTFIFVGSFESTLTPILFPFVQTYSICLKIHFTFLRGARWQRETDGQTCCRNQCIIPGEPPRVEYHFCTSYYGNNMNCR